MFISTYRSEEVRPSQLRFIAWLRYYRKRKRSHQSVSNKVEQRTVAETWLPWYASLAWALRCVRIDRTVQCIADTLIVWRRLANRVQINRSSAVQWVLMAAVCSISLNMSCASRAFLCSLGHWFDFGCRHVDSTKDVQRFVKKTNSLSLLIYK